MPLLLVLVTLFSSSARALTQTITCDGSDRKVTFKLIDGRPSSKHKTTEIRPKGAMITLLGYTPEVDEMNDGEISDSITFQRVYLGFEGQFSVRVSGCSSDCMERTSRCTSTLR